MYACRVMARLIRKGNKVLSQKSSFTVRILTSVKDKVRAESKRTGESINSIVERRLLESYKADAKANHGN